MFISWKYGWDETTLFDNVSLVFDRESGDVEVPFLAPGDDAPSDSDGVLGVWGEPLRPGRKEEADRGVYFWTWDEVREEFEADWVMCPSQRPGCVGERSTARCCSCGERLCITCDGAEVYDLAEWLEASTKCGTCARPVCAACAFVCRSCANRGDGITLCEQCGPKSKPQSVCKMHEWPVCEACSSGVDGEGKCGECRANRNFAGKMGDL